MSDGAAGRYVRFVLAATAAAAVLGAVGVPVTRAAAGSAAVGSMIAALLVCWASAALGGLPIARAARQGGRGRGQAQAAMLNAALGAMLLRLAAVAAGAAAVALAGVVPRGPFLAWIGVGYLALLVVETRYAVGEVRRQAEDGAADGGRNEGRAEPPPGRTRRMETR